MHQLASALLSFFLSPMLWIGLFALAGWLVRKKAVKKLCWAIAVLLFLVFSNAWLLNRYARHFQPPPLLLSQNVVFSCGIIPGGFASPDIDGNGIFNGTADRFIQALTLFKKGHIRHIIVSGGNGKKEMSSFREAAWVKQQFVIMGVPDSVIFVEDQSNNTLQNAGNTKKLLEANHLAPPYLLVSSAHHLPRAQLLYQKIGVATVGFPCSYIAGRGITTINDLVPGIGTLQTWNVYLKETAGYLWYKK
jgi:uncharacterized SAM-binding protein YcdF (DUF218 family)